MDEKPKDLFKSENLKESNDRERSSDRKKQKKDIDYDAQMEKLCRTLEIQNTHFTDSEKKRWIDLLEAYIGEDDHRLQYAYISNWVFAKFQSNGYQSLDNLGNGQTDVLGSVLSNLEAIVAYEEKLPENQKCPKRKHIILKMYDHISLAMQQCEMFGNAASVLDSHIADKVKDGLSEATKDITSQLVGLIGIFTALSFIVFGGFSSLESVISSISNIETSILPVVLIGIVWCFCMMNMLYAFMYFVLRVVKIRLSNDSQTGKNFVQRYPVICITNYLLFSAFIIVAAMWFAEKYGVGKKVFDTIVVKHSTGTFCLGIVLIVVSLCFLGMVLYFKYNQHRKDSTS